MVFESFLKRLSFRNREGSEPSGRCASSQGPRKWLPVIDADSCTGCGLCLQACEHGCLDMVWAFSTLLRPQDCGSEGHCMDACPEKVITMNWVALRKDRERGRWDDDAGDKDEDDPGAELDARVGSRP